jgi:lipid A 3-O-deacylase
MNARASKLLLVLLALLLPAALLAQSGEEYSTSLGPDTTLAVREPHWNAGIILYGGTGLFQDDDAQVASGGVRIGRVLTGEHGKGFLRGTLEWNAEFLPVDYVVWDGNAIYGIGVNPLILKWNFTGKQSSTERRRTIPYFLAHTGVLWFSHNVPPGDTSHFNFLSGAGIGLNHFFKPGRSVNIDLRAFHLSNASLGNKNPGINAGLEVSIGYNWWQH